MSARVTVTPFDVAHRYLGLAEVPGIASNPAVLAMLRLDATWPGGDDVPWCSAFVNQVCWLLSLPRSRSLAARSWLGVGFEVALRDAEAGDVVVLRRGATNGVNEPGPEVTRAPGHVGFFAGFDDRFVQVLGGNQGDSVSIARFPLEQLLSVRRLAP